MPSLSLFFHLKRSYIFFSFLFKKIYPFISVTRLQDFEIYVISGGKNNFEGWKCQKGVPFMSGVSLQMIRISSPWAILALESPTIQSHWPFKVWTMSNQILITNLVSDALTWWKTREHRAFQMLYTIVLLSTSHIGWITLLILENCRDNNGSARTLPDLV